MTNRDWVSTSIAAESLGTTREFLLKNRYVLFQNGIHWRSINPIAARPTYRWNLKKIEELMSSPEEY